MRAGALVVGEVPRLFEFADKANELRRSHRLCQRVVPRREIPLGRLAHAEKGRFGQIEHEVETIVSVRRLPGEVERSQVAAHAWRGP